MPRKVIRWTEDEIEFLHKNWSTMTDAELAGHLGRTKFSILGARQKYGLTSKESSNRKSSWTAEEVEMLRELWGSRTIPQIASKLSRSSHAVKVKSTRLGLGRYVDSSEYLTANQVANLMQVDIHAVTNRWIPCGLHFTWKAPAGKRKFRHIKVSTLMAWLKENQDKWDARRVEMFALGCEPEWLKEKRRSDANVPIKRAQKWSSEEDARLLSLFRHGGKTYAEIGAELGRSGIACEHRVHRLDVWGSGKYVGEATKEEREEKRNMSMRALLMIQLRNVLLARRNSMEYGEYWQKDLCQHWNDIKGCAAGCTDCDSCTEFERIKPQYCTRCGATIIRREREKWPYCDRCKVARKKDHQRKWRRLHGNATDQEAG